MQTIDLIEDYPMDRFERLWEENAERILGKGLDGARSKFSKCPEAFELLCRADELNNENSSPVVFLVFLDGLSKKKRKQVRDTWRSVGAANYTVPEFYSYIIIAAFDKFFFSEIYMREVGKTLSDEIKMM
ncbi:hypothetical protein KZZ07_00760 [Mameliella sp. CS4]|uniref:hypothetical protein n=1 Tax=Mameliella sp. CS4 TaxID=2862329 RepID=UPI001C5DA23F|nr:hypothetical protein [Mameliella sp. CS4]MBW4981057.1 hypothetical protein [Mameliella sp. CS4]